VTNRANWHKKEGRNQMDKKELEEGRVLHINFEKRGGFAPTIVQDVRNGQILMLAKTKSVVRRSIQLNYGRLKPINF